MSTPLTLDTVFLCEVNVQGRSVCDSRGFVGRVADSAHPILLTFRTYAGNEIKINVTRAVYRELQGVAESENVTDPTHTVWDGAWVLTIARPT